MTTPPRLTCSKCFRDEDVQQPVRLDDGSYQYTCNANHGGDGPHVWSKRLEDLVLPTRNGSSGEAETDDLLDPLLKVFANEDRWLEYGVVEYKLRQLAPFVFARHVAEAGHRMFGDSRETASKNRFSTALSRLEREGRLVHEMRLSTGAAWEHDKVVSYWAKPPAPPASKTLTWTAYCIANGRPDGWTDEDLAGLTPPKS